MKKAFFPKSPKMKKILLIGGCGYIGSRLYDYLIEKKYSVQTVDLEWFGNIASKNNLKRNYKFLPKSFLNTFDIIILLAGYSSVSMTVRKPRQSFKNDVENFVSLLHKLSHQRFIYASSSSIYGNTKKMQVTEDYDRYSPLNHYDLHKKTIDNYAGLSTLDYYGLRLGTVCGYSHHLRIDLMVNKMYHTSITGRKIMIHNPSMYRPILGIHDFCRAVDEIIKAKPKPGIYNLASLNATIGEVSDVVSKMIGKVKVVVECDKSLYNFSVDTAKFRTAFNFTFTEDIPSIVKSLKRGYVVAHKTVRE